MLNPSPGFLTTETWLLYDSDYRKLKDQTQEFDGKYAQLLKTINEWIGSEPGQKAYNSHIKDFAE